MLPDHKSIAHEVRRAIDQDGLFELGIGVSFLFTTLLVLSRLRSLTGVVTVVILAIVVPLARNKVTYPRIGYAKPKEPPFLKILLAVLGIAAVSLAVIALVLLVQGRLDSRQAWRFLLPLGFGVFVACFHLLWGIRTGALRHFVLGAVSAVGGVLAVLLSGGSSVAGANIYFLGFGTLQLVIGTVLLVRFLARHPRPREVNDDA
jgi:hypothetical protein